MTEPKDASGFPWIEVLKVFWDMRWALCGIAVVTVGVYFGVEFRDVLFPHRRSLSPTDWLMAVAFVGLLLWGYSNDTRKRVEKLEQQIEDLERKLRSQN
jgi:hypothetical protein